MPKTDDKTTKEKTADKAATTVTTDFEAKFKELEARIENLENTKTTLEVTAEPKTAKVTLPTAKLLKIFSDVKVQSGKDKKAVLTQKHILDYKVKDGKVTIVTSDGQKISRVAA